MSFCARDKGENSRPTDADKGAPMRKTLLTVLCLSLLAGCGDGAKDLFETAQFEERQFNASHSAILYRRIVAEYSSSPYAAKAQERLNAIESK